MASTFEWAIQAVVWHGLALLLAGVKVVVAHYECASFWYPRGGGRVTSHSTKQRNSAYESTWFGKIEDKPKWLPPAVLDAVFAVVTHFLFGYVLYRVYVAIAAAPTGYGIAIVALGLVAFLLSLILPLVVYFGKSLGGAVFVAAVNVLVHAALLVVLGVATWDPTVAIGLSITPFIIACVVFAFGPVYELVVLAGLLIKAKDPSKTYSLY